MNRPTLHLAAARQRPAVLLYKCERCGWYGSDPSWSDNTPYEMRPDGSKPAYTEIPICRGCFKAVRCEPVA